MRAKIGCRTVVLIAAPAPRAASTRPSCRPRARRSTHAGRRPDADRPRPRPSERHTSARTTEWVRTQHREATPSRHLHVDYYVQVVDYYASVVVKAGRPNRRKATTASHTHPAEHAIPLATAAA